MTTPLVIIGAGGFGRETLDVVEASNASGASGTYDVIGVLDDDPSELALERLADRGVEYLGSTASWLISARAAEYLIGIGDPATRRRIDRIMSSRALRAATVVHPAAVIGSRVTLGAGTVVCGGVQMSTNVRVGRHVHINPHATIGHDSVLGDFVSINPSATISGDCVLEPESYVGSSAVVLQGLRVGGASVIGAASCVTKDVPPSITVVGVPASPRSTGARRARQARTPELHAPFATTRQMGQN